MEELPGDRQVIITASDASSTATATLTVSVQIFNNNPPMIMFQGDDTAVFVEGRATPYPVGMCLTDAWCMEWSCRIIRIMFENLHLFLLSQVLDSDL